MRRTPDMQRPDDMPYCNDLLDLLSLRQQADVYNSLAREKSLTSSSIVRFKRAALAMRLTANFIERYGRPLVERIANEPA